MDGAVHGVRGGEGGAAQSGTSAVLGELTGRLATFTAVAFVVVATAVSAFNSPLGSDYAKFCPRAVCDDPAAAISGLAHGHPSAVWDEQPAMGPVSVVLRAPAAALAQLGSDSPLAQYRWGAFACLLAAGLLLLSLAAAGLRRGASPLVVAIFAAGLILGPLTYRALDIGHPEEPLAAALVVAAIVGASSGRVRLSAVLLALAVGTKQWAVLGAGPVLLAAAPELRRTLTAISLAVALVLFLPVVAGNTDRFRAASHEAASPSANATPTNVWWPLARSEPDPSLAPGTERRRPPAAVRALARWLVLAIAAGASVALGLYRRDPGVAAALALAALLFLLRCMLDPYTFSYHHWPFLVALAAYEVVGRRRLPVLAAVASVLLWYMSYRLGPRGDPDPLLRTYLAWTIPMAITLVWLGMRSVSCPGSARPVPSRSARSRPAA